MKNDIIDCAGTFNSWSDMGYWCLCCKRGLWRQSRVGNSNHCIHFDGSDFSCSPIIGYSNDNAAVEKDYYGYLAIKQTYELAIGDEKLTGLERLEITKVAMEQNKALARKKVDMGKWYSFAITEEDKQLILSLEPIA